MIRYNVNRKADKDPILVDLQKKATVS